MTVPLAVTKFLTPKNKYLRRVECVNEPTWSLDLYSLCDANEIGSLFGGTLCWIINYSEEAWRVDWHRFFTKETEFFLLSIIYLVINYEKSNMNKILSLFSALVLVYILVFSEMTRDPGDLVAPLCWMEEILESLSLRSRTSSSLVLPWVWFLHYEKLSFQLLTVSPDVNCWAHWVIQ